MVDDEAAEGILANSSPSDGGQDIEWLAFVRLSVTDSPCPSLEQTQLHACQEIENVTI